MASLYKKPIWIKDPTTGERIKDTSKKWWGQFRDPTGLLHRRPLCADKRAAQAMLNDLVRQAEREHAGLVDPTDRQRMRPLPQHLSEFSAYLRDKGVSAKQQGERTRQLDKITAACQWKKPADITATSLLEYLGGLRRDGRSAQTYNHYLRAAKQFTRWMLREQRIVSDPLGHLSKLNTNADRRHDRRALSAEEFTRLLEAARTGKRIEGISGPDRAMMYALASWTGFRKGEIGSLTRRSLQLATDPPTASVAACYSKRRRLDVQVLHPVLASQLGSWLATKGDLPADAILFPVSERVPSGKGRKTNKMMQRDLEQARQAWIAEAETTEERAAREAADFLCYQDHHGRFADFHGLRHLFITSLERAGVSPRMAQSLARHSDIRLTMNVYTHIELSDQTAAIASLPAPPQAVGREGRCVELG